jgi:mannan polymerase II complex ANP1 subunit
MSKRLRFSVVGLPHYTIWHLYEPSVDDLKHMEEMDKERKQQEAKDKLEKDRLEQVRSQFDDTKSEWEKEKEAMEKMEKEEKDGKAQAVNVDKGVQEKKDAKS